MRNGMFLTFSQQILCGKLLQIVIGEIKSHFSGKLHFKNIVDVVHLFIYRLKSNV